MRKLNKKTFSDLVLENKQELMKDIEAMNRIEERFEKKHEIKVAK